MEASIGLLSQAYRTYDQKKEKRGEKIIKINRSNQLSDVDVRKEKAEEHVLKENIVEEHFYLMLEEAFFLSFVLECLTVLYQNKAMTVEEMWEKFQQTQPYFVERYATYHFVTAPEDEWSILV